MESSIGNWEGGRMLTSFISFHTCTSAVLSTHANPPPSLSLSSILNLNSPLHQPQLAGWKKSTQALLPLQHQPSYSVAPSACFVSTPRAAASAYTG